MNTNHPPVTPEEIEEARLTAYALDQLDDGERKLVETLLQGDPKARRTVEETRRVAEMLREAMRQAPPTGPSSSLRSSVDQYLESGQAEEPPVEPVSPAAKHDPSPRRWLAVRWAAAALAVCFLAGVTAVLYGPRLPRVRELAETRRPLHQSEPALAPASSPLPAIEADQASPGAADKRALDELRTRGAADEPSAGAALQASSSGEVVGRSVAKAGAVLKGAPSTHHDWKYGAAPVATAAPSTAPSAGLSPPSDAAAPAGSPALAAKPDTGLAARALMRRAETATGSQDESLRRSRKAEESVAPRSAATASRPEAPSEAGGYPGMMPGMEIGFPAAAPALQAEEPLDPRSAARASRPEAPSEAGGYPGMTPGMMPGMEMGSPAAAPALQAEASVGRELGDRMAKQDAREGGGMGGAAYGAGGYGQEKIKEQSDLALLESASGVGADRKSVV